MKIWSKFPIFLGVTGWMLANAWAGPAPPAYQYSSGLSDVLQLLDAKVDSGVITAYIKNSTVPYNPSAADIIALKEHGVPPEVLTALLQRGGELRAQAAQGLTAAQGQYPSYPGTEAMTPSYPYPADYGTDNGLYPPDYGGYGGGYPGGWWWGGWSWPWWGGWSWPWWGFGFNNFHHHHFNHFNHFNRFNHFNHVNHFNNQRMGAFAPAVGFNARFQSRSMSAFSPVVSFKSFNRPFVTPRVGVSTLGVPSRANGAAAFAGGSASVAFVGRSGGSAGMVRPPGGGGVRNGFAFRGGGMAMGRGGGMAMGHGGGGGGGHR